MKKIYNILNYTILLSVLIQGSLFLSSAHAEYRAYQYLLSGTSKEQKNTTILTNSYTPVAMTKYYGISKERLYLLRTWICPGHTGGKKVCVPPYQAQNLENFLLEEKQGEL